MGTRARPAEGGNTLAEMREFAGFSASTQRYIRRSLDISLHRRDALEFWSRDGVEAASIRTQTRMYDRLVYIRSLIPDDSGLEQLEPLLPPLVAMSAFDRGPGRLSYRTSGGEGTNVPVRVDHGVRRRIKKKTKR